MAVRDSAEIGPLLYKIASTLLKDNNLKRLLFFSDSNPLDISRELPSDASILNTYIKVVPLVKEEESTTRGVLVIAVSDGIPSTSNTEFKNLRFEIFIYTPLSTWVINDITLRPFLIISEIEKTLADKRINNFGILQYDGFTRQYLSEHYSCYKMEFSLNAFN